MSPIKPLSNLTSQPPSAPVDRAQRRQLLLATEATESANGERNARATEVEVRRSRIGGSGDGRGSTIDIIS